jgi:hypothetical protein
VQIEQQLGADGGPQRLQRTVFDERGNVLAIDTAELPDSTWHPVVRRSYDCFKR